MPGPVAGPPVPAGDEFQGVAVGAQPEGQPGPLVRDVTDHRVAEGEPALPVGLPHQTGLLQFGERVEGAVRPQAGEPGDVLRPERAAGHGRRGRGERCGRRQRVEFGDQRLRRAQQPGRVGARPLGPVLGLPARRDEQAQVARIALGRGAQPGGERAEFGRGAGSGLPVGGPVGQQDGHLLGGEGAGLDPGHRPRPHPVLQRGPEGGRGLPGPVGDREQERGGRHRPHQPDQQRRRRRIAQVDVVQHHEVPRRPGERPVARPVEPLLRRVQPLLRPVEPLLRPVQPLLRPVEPLLRLAGAARRLPGVAEDLPRAGAVVPGVGPGHRDPAPRGQLQERPGQAGLPDPRLPGQLDDRAPAAFQREHGPGEHGEFGLPPHEPPPGGPLLSDELLRGEVPGRRTVVLQGACPLPLSTRGAPPGPTRPAPDAPAPPHPSADLPGGAGRS